eukprot:GEMP01090236.1.p1 GENE.GEMP01090236.1~~GEMP01090236.1.p1  ORF type:complete len:229 (+),score=40.95 GEMP01090236.1:42-728(+)
MGEDLPYLILDTGAHTLKCRWSDDPAVTEFPGQIGYQGKKPIIGNALKSECMSLTSLFWPQRLGVLESLEGAKLLWDALFVQLDEALDARGEGSLLERCIFSSFPLGTDPKIIEDLYEIFLEKYGFAGCRMANTQLMAAQVSPGPSLVVDLGLAAARACVVADYKPVSATVASHLGGYEFTDSLRSHLCYRHNSADVWSWHRVNDLLSQARCHPKPTSQLELTKYLFV